MWPVQGRCAALRNSALRYWPLAVAVLVLDLLSKWAANAYLDYGQPLAVLPHFNLTLHYNTGAAFSFLADAGGWQRWAFSLLALVMIAVMLWWLHRLPPRLNCEALGLHLVIGGAAGNLLERLWDGRVTDFFDFYIGSWHYATFNGADVAITLGAVCLVVHEFILRPRQERSS
ncbi:MAG TPA: lipoprotein signal peptidase [Sulfurivirga caldicuralii]|nr:lipoprotein signal peptidase [Sulfurivirga caldicuralii]